MVHYRFYNSLPLYPLVSQNKPSLIFITYIFEIHFNIMPFSFILL